MNHSESVSIQSRTNSSLQNISSLSKHSKTDLESLNVSPFYENAFDTQNLIADFSHNNYKTSTSLGSLPLISLRRSQKQQQQQHNPILLNTNAQKQPKKDEFSRNDWSKTNCSLFLTPIEDFLENQRKREKSSRKKCDRKLRAKLVETLKQEKERKIKDFDEKIQISLLLKKIVERRSTMSTASSQSQSACTNYRLLMAQEKRNDNCDRCTLKNRKQEESFLQKCVETPNISLSSLDIKRPRVLPTTFASDYSKKLLKSIYFRRISNNNVASDWNDKHELMSNRLLRKMPGSKFSFGSNEIEFS